MNTQENNEKKNHLAIPKGITFLGIPCGTSLVTDNAYLNKTQNYTDCALSNLTRPSIYPDSASAMA
jgi:hypothetical protein